MKFLAIKASKSGLLVQKSWGLFKFCCTGGLIKSGALYASIRYLHTYYLNTTSCSCTEWYKIEIRRPPWKLLLSRKWIAPEYVNCKKYTLLLCTVGLPRCSQIVQCIESGTNFYIATYMVNTWLGIWFFPWIIEGIQLNFILWYFKYVGTCKCTKLAPLLPTLHHDTTQLEE